MFTVPGGYPRGIHCGIKVLKPLKMLFAVELLHKVASIIYLGAFEPSSPWLNFYNEWLF